MKASAFAPGIFLLCLIAWIPGCGGGTSTAPALTITWETPAPISYGTALTTSQLAATANVPGQFAYSPGIGTILDAGSQTLSATFTPQDSSRYGATSASVTLLVNQATPVLTWAAPSAIVYGTPLTATHLNAVANTTGTFIYSPAAGTILNAGAQTLKATFAPTDAKNFTGASGQTTLQVNQATPVLTWTASPAIVYGTPLTATQLNAAANTTGTFTYSPAAGTVLEAGTQTLKATFAPADAKNYTDASAQTTLLVNQATPVLTWSAPLAIVYGTPLTATQLNAAANTTGTFTYSPTPGTVLEAGTQTLKATFAPADAKNYTDASAQTTLLVNLATPVLTWSAPTAIVYSTPLSAIQLNAVANITGTFSYSPAAGTVLNAGTQTLKATFAPKDNKNYTDASAQTTLQVSKGTPALHWATPFPIAINMPLAAGQLSVTATYSVTGAAIAGRYAFTPPAGTSFPSAGAQQISTIFTPQDSKNYTQSSGQINIDVLPVGIVAWGDSMTVGGYQAVSYASLLATVMVFPVLNAGLSHQTSTQIGVREGGVATQVTITGGAIPPTGDVGIQFPEGFEPVNIHGPPHGLPATVAGVRGVVAMADQNLIFTRSEAGPAVPAPAPLPFLVDTPYAQFVPIFWEGRNNTDSPSVVLSDLQAQVNKVPADKDYVVLAIPNTESPGERIGGGKYSLLLSLNNQLANAFGSHFLDIRPLLKNAYDPTSVIDVSDISQDAIPTSLRPILGSGTLATAIGPSDTTISVNLTDSSPRLGFVLTIDSGSNAENVYIVAVTGSVASVLRGIAGTVTAHGAGVPVALVDPVHFTTAGNQIIANAVAAYLSHDALSNSNRAHPKNARIR